jgi:hypothetical protein
MSNVFNGASAASVPKAFMSFRFHDIFVSGVFQVCLIFVSSFRLP